MTRTEFGEIEEAWTELKSIYDEIEMLNTEEQPVILSGASAAPAAAAQ